MNEFHVFVLVRFQLRMQTLTDLSVELSQLKQLQIQLADNALPSIKSDSTQKAAVLSEYTRWPDDSTQTVLAHLGDFWFVKVTPTQAQRILQRRIHRKKSGYSSFYHSWIRSGNHVTIMEATATSIILKHVDS